MAAHGEQRYEEHPYAFHLDEVAVLVRTYGDVAQAVAYLQDVIEHTDATPAQLREAFGEQIARCVELLTEQPGLSRKERNLRSFARLAEVVADSDDAVALIAKTADRLANVQRCFLNEDRGGLRKLRRDQRDFRAAVFRPGIADALWEELTDLISP